MVEKDETNTPKSELKKDATSESSPAAPKRKLTVLSIDGFGIHSIIPAKVLIKLEKLLQDKDGKDKRISDYFDVVSSTGAGAYIAALLTAKGGDRDRYSAEDILKSLENLFKKARCSCTAPAPATAEDSSQKGRWGRTQNRFWDVIQALKSRLTMQTPGVEKLIVKEIEKELGPCATLSTTSSDIVIPVFDLDCERPFLLSTAEAKELKKDKFEDIKLSDVVIASISTLFTANISRPVNYRGKIRNFTDGCLATANPSLLAVQEAEWLNERPDYENFLVLSLGTAQKEEIRDGIWNIKSWIFRLTKESLVDWVVRVQQYVYGTLSEIVEIHMSTLFPADSDNINQYLRIKDYSPEENLPSMVDASEENIEKLKRFGEKILHKQVVRINPVTGAEEKETVGKPAEGKSGKPFASYQAALEDFAQQLVDERKDREKTEEGKRQSERKDGEQKTEQSKDRVTESDLPFHIKKITI